MNNFDVHNITTETYLGKISFADKSIARMKGLLGTRELPAFQGLLLSPCKQVHTIGMHYPISVWYLDGEMQIIQIVDNLLPWRISPFVRDSALIIEFPQDWAQKTESKVRDRLQLR